MKSIGDFAVDLDSAVDRAGMHDQAIRFQKFCAFFRQTKQPDVFAEPGKIFSALALVLNSQKIYDIGFRQHVIDFVPNFDSEFFKLAWHKRARPDQRHARAEFKQPEDVGARDATEENVANDRDVQASDFSSTFADRVKIEEGLRGVFMRTVAGIDYACFESICQELRSL